MSDHDSFEDYKQVAVTHMGSPARRYFAHGSARPPEAKLLEYSRRLEPSRKVGHWLIHADVQVDLAMSNPEHADIHLATAKDLLDDTTTLGDDMFDRELYESFAKQSDLFLQAALKKAELAHWKQATQGNTVALDYEEMLTASDDASRYVINDTSAGFILEYVPVLFMARAAKQGQATQITGRLALSREDSILFSAPGVNPRWDSGVSFDTSAASYDQPEQRLQVKRGKKGSRTAYTAAGIRMIRANSYGFQDAVKIVDSLLHERGGDITPGTEIFTSGEIDAMSDSLLADLSRGPIA